MSDHYPHRVTGCFDCPYLTDTTTRPAHRCSAPVGEQPDAEIVTASVSGKTAPPPDCVLRDLPLLVIGMFEGGPMGRPQGACTRHSEPSIAHVPGAPTAEQGGERVDLDEHEARRWDRR